ncbi:MAG TPA: acylphosphatase [Candidatus Omnitrophota bacterium]|nr:acylphosphatase [Candidatus Omnitrophota bacterium]HPN88031.1 acylphosphatase [Candidatus Omnitrophota bacterium]
MKQAHIIYSGFVQGVGFRFMTQKFAEQLNLKGWVKNLSNGSVEIIVEGPESQIASLIQKLEEHFKSYIHYKEMGFSSPDGHFTDFRIVY